ncbi:MAG: hypothetical protein WBA76_12420, partial [Phormidesmis sp.]
DAVEKGEFRRAIAPNPTSSSDAIANNAAKNSRPHLLDVNSWIAEEQLTVQWIFSDRHHKPQDIEHLAERFILHLTALIEHCCTKESVEYVPDDFGLVQLDQSALEAVLNQVSFATTNTAEQEVAQ